MDVTRNLDVGQFVTLTFSPLKADSTPATISGVPSWTFEMATNGDTGVMVWGAAANGLTATLTAQRMGYMVLVVAVVANVDFGSGVVEVQKAITVELTVTEPPASGSLTIDASGVS